jgi:hypothetical protein
MTLWLPMLDYARSYRPTVEQITRVIPREACVVTTNLSRPQLAALAVHGNWRVTRQLNDTRCGWLLVDHVTGKPLPSAIQGQPVEVDWQLVQRVRRPTDRQETLLIYKRR